MMGSRRHGRTSVRPNEASTGRQIGRSILAGVVVLLVAIVGISCSDSSPSATATPSSTASSSPAPSNTVWLCRPGLADNPCEGDLTTTVVSADGTSTTEQAASAKDPPIDCFYVYPTVSLQTTENANLQIDPDEKTVAIQQAARFSQVCKVYAPMYRQATVKAITSPGGSTQATRDLAYSDVLSAWQDYMAHYNQGRGVVFIGHSQGTGMLTRLIAAEVDPSPDMRRLLVSALLIGGNVTVAKGLDVGGDFQNIPACRSTSQTGCVVAYSSFNEPPPPDSRFGKVGVGPSSGKPANANLQVLCVNPASLSGGTGSLKAYYSTAPLSGVFGRLVGAAPSVPTPWLSTPGQYTAHCESSDDANWLQVDTTSIPGDQRPVVSQVLGPTWGLHLVDVNIALGNLVELVRQQTAAFSPSSTASSSPAPSNTVWLCRPGLADNPCESDLATTVVSADGTSTTESATRAEDPPIDCFYVYPTVSAQKTQNATLQIDPEERAIAIQQASRFSQVCKVYAPMYRQLTLKAINSAGGDTAAARAMAYGDVLSAWQDYMAHYNQGRGVVLIGHSQGTMMLTQLVADEVDPNPSVRRLLVSALLIGGNVTVAKGQDVGGDFQNIPACRSADQTGCVVAYSTFNEAPPPDAIFGRVGVGPIRGQQDSSRLQVLCVNPASLSGGTGSLKTYFGTAPFPGLLGALLGKLPPIPTPWVAYPGLYTAHCESSGGASWLQVDTTNIAGDQRPVVSQSIGPAWGLHLYDVSIALGNLVDLVRQQGAAFSQE
jgi:pimeloyl-ACP methyl ester carboxylesterase